MSRLMSDNRVIAALFLVLMVINTFAIRAGYYA